ncbi:MAG: hypothetical protein WCQ96_03990 [Patescibacteria group bacterium]
MHLEESSRLISDLYSAKTEQEVCDVLEFMGESGDGVFVYPILDGYKKYKNSSVGCYFLWSMSLLDYSNLGEALDELLGNYDIRRDHIPMVLFFMAERNYSSDVGDRMAAMYLDSCTDPEFRADFNLNGIGLGCVLGYLFRENLLFQYEGKLRELVFSKNSNPVEQAVALIYLLEIRQEEQLGFFIDNYFTEIQNANMEKGIAREIVFCDTNNARKLKKLILENGDADAVAILEKLGKKAGSFPSDASENVIYSNANAVTKIGILRAQINNKTLASEEFGFAVFPGNELLIYLSHSADDREIFFSMCGDLLEVVGDVSPDIKSHSFDKKEFLELPMDVAEDKEETLLARLISFLDSHEIGDDYNLFGFRQLVFALELMVKHEEDENFFQTLRRMGVEPMYREKKWHSLHSFFLNYYIQVLENMSKDMNRLTKRSEESQTGAG